MLSVDFCGLKLKNPVIVASATPSIDVQSIKRAAANGAGAVVTKSVMFPDSSGRPTGANPRPKFQLYNTPGGYDPVLTEKGGMFSFFRIEEPYPTPEKMTEMLKELKGPNGVDIPIIVSICGFTGDYESWRKLARMMEDAGADALELNGHMWNPYSRFTDPVIASVVKKEVKIPVIFKMMGVTEDPTEVAPKIVAAGADGITGLGTFGLDGIELDVEAEKPWFSETTGLGGPWLRPVSLAFVSRIANSTNVPISGVTGIQCAEDAIKYILMGASTIQVCGAIYARGYKVLQEIADGIEAWMKKKGYKNIEEFRGKALPYLTGVSPQDQPVRAYVTDKCKGCKMCLDSCMFDALHLKDGKAFADERCDGCGVCWSMCKYRAIEMREYK